VVPALTTQPRRQAKVAARRVVPHSARSH
jgi:hypothetical protein